MPKYHVGQRVQATDIGHWNYDDTDTLEGVITAYDAENGYLINFGAHFDGHDGTDELGTDELGEGTMWWVSSENVSALPTPIAQDVARPSHAKQQTDRILNHLLAGNSISQLEAFGVYRLAARIHDLKAKGHKIVTTMKKDANGKPYAEYALVSRRRVA
jgi:hypothetical protein